MCEPCSDHSLENSIPVKGDISNDLTYDCITRTLDLSGVSEQISNDISCLSYSSPLSGSEHETSRSSSGLNEGDGGDPCPSINPAEDDIDFNIYFSDIEGDTTTKIPTTPNKNYLSAPEDGSPTPNNLSTPNVSVLSIENGTSDSPSSDIGSDTESDSESDVDNARNILREIRVKNVGRIVIGTLNINSLASKFDQLEIIIRDSLDILIIQETKLDSSFPDDQFVINGYKKPYRLDRNRHGGGVMVYIR